MMILCKSESLQSIKLCMVEKNDEFSYKQEINTKTRKT